MVCQATINRIWQKGGEWIYDILFTDSSDGHYGQDNVPEDELRVDPAARGAVNQNPPAATHVPFAGVGAKLSQQ